MKQDIKIFTTNIEQSASEQIERLLQQDAFNGSKIRIMPDVHAGAGCVINHREYAKYSIDSLFINKKTEKQQWRYILSKRHFITLPHTNGVLFEYFIKPTLDKKGIPINGRYSLIHNGKTIEYIIVNIKN